MPPPSPNVASRQNADDRTPDTAARVRRAAALLVIAAALLATATLARSSGPDRDVAPAGPLAEADRSCALLLGRAVAALGGENEGWLETEVWQEVNTGNLSYHAVGRLQAAPGGRTRLELTTCVGTTHGRLLVVQDGVYQWQAIRIGAGLSAQPEAWTTIRRTNLRAVAALLAQSSRREPSGTSLYRTLSTAGVVPLLEHLRRRAVWVRREAVLREGRELLRLTGLWPPEDAEGDERSRSPEILAGRPTQCRLYLDPRTLWPCRLEWWGGAERLAQTEFRNPVRNRPLSPEQCARLFRFDPAGADFKDDTELIRDTLNGSLAGTSPRGP